MSQEMHWPTRFNIPEDALTQYTQEARAAGADLLYWCLMNDKIPQGAYMEWATKAFELPSVKGDFFTSPPDLTLWSRVRTQGPWSPNLVPLTEWDGCLFIGCLEPAVELKLAKPHRFVLASARQLFMLWDQLNASAPSRSSAPVKPPQPTTRAAAPPAPAASPPPVPENSSRDVASDDSDGPTVRVEIERVLPPRNTAKTPQNSENEAMRTSNPMDVCSSKLELGNLVLSRILEIFEGAMILTFEKNALKPWLFSGLLASEKNRNPETVEIETPSIFRIVARTRLPYHGYVTPSPTNNVFFNAYLNGQLPKHATLAPIISEEDEFFGMLMGIAQKEIDYKKSLIRMERLADEMSIHLKRLKRPNAA